MALHDLAEVARRQHGAFTRQQAHAVGLTDDRLKARRYEGLIVRIGPNAFRFPGTDIEPINRLGGLLLDIGAPCWAYGPTAAALHRFDGFMLVEPFHVVIPRSRQIRRVGVSIHTSEYLPLSDRAEREGVAVLRPERTLIDLSRLVDRRSLLHAVDGAARDRMVNEDRLRQRLYSLSTKAQSRLGVDNLLAVLEGAEIERGGHSYLERRFLSLMSDHGLPRPDTQQVLGRTSERLIRVDFRFPGTPVVVEVLGYRYHRSRDQMAVDAARMNDLVQRGFRPYQFTFDQVVEHADDTVRTVARALGIDRAP